jgi:serine/threonine protein kinase
VKKQVVMEYMSGGCLTEVLDQYRDVQLKEDHIAYLCAQVLKGLEYIHHFHRIHRDIKSDNILLGAHGTVKLGMYSYLLLASHHCLFTVLITLIS